MKYTAEEVREWAAFAQAQGKLYAPIKGAHEPWAKLEAMLTAYAERIKADESAVPAAWQYRYKNDRLTWSKWLAWAPEEHPEAPFPKTIGRWEVEYRELFARPPAQAAQGEASPGRCKACGRATRVVCDGLDGNGLGCTNATSIDIAAVRKVIESHINEAKKLRHDPESQDYLHEQADKLEAAIRGGA